MPENTQHKLSRIRPPRVHITYDVEARGAVEKRELPLVVGILADLSGMPDQPRPALKDRKFVEIDRDNFNDIMASIAPRLEMSIENKLAQNQEGGRMNLELSFRHIDDFSPLNVVMQIKELRRLLDARQRLSDLLAKLNGNDVLDQILRQVSANPDEVKQLKAANQGETAHA